MVRLNRNYRNRIILVMNAFNSAYQENHIRISREEEELQEVEKEGKKLRISDRNTG